MLAAHYRQILLLHVACVVLSGTLFAVRGVFRLADLPIANHRLLRVSSYLIDTALLSAAILLTLIVHQYPFANGWLTTKVLLLAVYIILGMMALKHARTLPGRAAALVTALLTFLYIIGVAVTHHPLGWLVLLHQ